MSNWTNETLDIYHNNIESEQEFLAGISNVGKPASRDKNKDRMEILNPLNNINDPLKYKSSKPSEVPPITDDTNILSYAKILKDINDFKKSGAKHSKDFNIFDIPSHKYFKILFYFGDSATTKTNMNDSDYSKSNGLLHPTWLVESGASSLRESSSNSHSRLYNYNSAWSYLMFNAEYERAHLLKNFIELLSNINSESPWYFQSIEGIESALERKGPDSGAVEFGDEKKSISIKCLPDSFDNRIGTLLELYRTITWNWHQKKEVLPANLRKFDMAVYIFESPVHFWHDYKNSYPTIDAPKKHDTYSPSYKLIEFHDCEFNYNSLKSGYTEFNNQNGFTPTYTIDIIYEDCYEASYNEFLLKELGDIIMVDTISTDEFTDFFNVANEVNINTIKNRSNAAENNNEAHFEHAKKYYSFGNIGNVDNSDSEQHYMYNEHKKTLENERILNVNSWVTEKEKEQSEKSPGILGTALGQIAYLGKQHVDNWLYDKIEKTTSIKQMIMGNLNKFSLSRLADNIEQFVQGNIITPTLSVKKYIETSQQRAAEKVKNKQNLPKSNIGGNISGNSDTVPTKSRLGNLNEGHNIEENKFNSEYIGDIFEDNPEVRNWRLGNIFKINKDYNERS